MITPLTVWARGGFILALFLRTLSIAAQPASADKGVEKKVGEIRKLYAAASERIKAGAGDEGAGYYQNELVIGSTQKPWAAVGNYKVVVRLYYDLTEDEARKPQLVKATEAIDIAARKYTAEFLFNSKGDLLFYFIKPAGEAHAADDALRYPDEPNTEVRCYFEADKAIRVIVGKETKDALSPSEQAVAASGLARARAIQALFAASMKVQ